MPSSRVLTDQPWADVVVDLRANRSAPLPTKPFTGRRKFTLNGVTVTGARRSHDGHDLGIIKWTDATGFTGAVVAVLGAGGEFTSIDDVLPHVRHLTSDHPSSKWKNASVPRERGEAVFAASLDGLRHLLTDGSLHELVPGSVSLRDSLLSRLAWAAVGVTDLTTVPFVLRDWRAPAFDGDDRSDPSVWPEDLSLRGPGLVASWQRHGFDTATSIGEWVTLLYPGLEQAISETSARGLIVQNLATWQHAGFDPTETLEWYPAATYNDEFTPRFVAADVCAEMRDRGVSAEHMAYLTLHLRTNDRDAPASIAANHVRAWLRVSDDPARVCGYIAAGYDRAEAKTVERSEDRPDLDQLAVMAGLAGHTLTVD